MMQLKQGPPVAHWKSIDEWKPQVGDLIVWHGWINHWFGLICNIEGINVEFVKSTVPIMMLNQYVDDSKMNTVSVVDIQNASAGTYAILRSEGNVLMWYVK